MSGKKMNWNKSITIFLSILFGLIYGVVGAVTVGDMYFFLVGFPIGFVFVWIVYFILSSMMNIYVDKKIGTEKINWETGFFRITLVSSILLGIFAGVNTSDEINPAWIDFPLGFTLGFDFVWIVYFILIFIIRGFKGMPPVDENPIEFSNDDEES